MPASRARSQFAARSARAVSSSSAAEARPAQWSSSATFSSRSGPMRGKPEDRGACHGEVLLSFCRAAWSRGRGCPVLRRSGAERGRQVFGLGCDRNGRLPGRAPSGVSAVPRIPTAARQLRISNRIPWPSVGRGRLLPGSYRPRPALSCAFATGLFGTEDKRNAKYAQSGQITARFVRTVDKRSGIGSDTARYGLGSCRLSRIPASPQSPARDPRAARSGADLACRDRPAHRIVALDRLEPGVRPAGGRAGGGARGARRGPRHPGRAPADPAVVRLLGGCRRRHRLRSQPPARGGLGSVVTDPGRARTAAGHRSRRRGGTRRRRRPGRRTAGRGRRRQRPGDRRRHGPAGSDPPGGWRGRLVGDPARVGRRAGGGGDAPPARHADPRRQRREPRRSRRGRVRGRARRERPRVPEGGVRDRRRTDPQRPSLPRQHGAGRRARPPARGSRGPRVPVRQPRLPRDPGGDAVRSSSCCGAATASM